MVSASYAIGGIVQTATQQVSVVYVPPPPTFTSLTISGPVSIIENNTEEYSATEWFSDGSSQVVVPAWSVISPNATISNFGLLSAGEVSSNTVVVVDASYTDGATITASNAVTVLILPKFSGISANNGKFQATLSGLSLGQTVVFYVSSDLIVWVPIHTNSILTGSTFTFTNTFNYAVRGEYFRAFVQ
jgi:hypothetical protein